MSYYLDEQSSKDSESSLLLLSELVQEQIQRRPRYRCGSCGFSGQSVHWLCPSCKKWGVVKPIKGLDGE